MWTDVEKSGNSELKGDNKIFIHKALSNPKRMRILEVVSQSPTSLSAEDLSELLDLHINTVRSHIAVLMDAGLITQSVVKSKKPGRPSVGYLSKANDRDMPSSYDFMATVLVSELATKPYGQELALNAGRHWGRYLTPQVKPGKTVSIKDGVKILSDLLNKIGFEVSTDRQIKIRGAKTSDKDLTIKSHKSKELDPLVIQSKHDIKSKKPIEQIRVNRCPFKRVAIEYSNIVCSIHLGLISGVFESLGIASVEPQLYPFSGPSECRLDLIEQKNSKLLASLVQLGTHKSGDDATYKDKDKQITTESSNKKRESNSIKKERRNKDMEPKILDVRPILAKGEEPFGLIIDTVNSLEENQDLIIYAPFDPIPLEGVMAEKGFGFEVTPIKDGDFKVRFFRS
jgi:predicted ArsR family transcriptional regulator